MPKILFVEDDPFIAEIYKKKFQASGLEFTHVETGKSALNAASNDRYDLVLLDLVIPEMNGKEVLKELRENGRYDRSLKVVVFSNLSGPEDREECTRLGADGFIPKAEFTPSEVIEEIWRFLGSVPEEEATAGPGAEAESGTGKKRILFIEDEDIFVDMFGRRLRDEGYEVVARTDGSSGLEAALAGGFDMLITDIMLPGVGGEEIVSRLRQTEGGKTVPIIVLSASADEERLDAIAKRDMVDRVFLKTRSTPSDLASAVNEVFLERASIVGNA